MARRPEGSDVDANKEIAAFTVLFTGGAAVQSADNDYLLWGCGSLGGRFRAV